MFALWMEMWLKFWVMKKGEGKANAQVVPKCKGKWPTAKGNIILWKWNISTYI
jgi:hypothetical protein